MTEYTAPVGAPAWIDLMTYDVDAAAKRIVDAGGQILRAAEVTPWGTMGSATDPGGAVFLFATPPEGR